MSKPPPNRHQIDQPDDSHEVNDQPNTEVMTAYAEPDADDEGHDDDAYDEFGDDAGTPGRPRRALVNRYSVGLVVVLVGAGCFYGGVRVEKSQVGTSASGAGGLASRFAAASAGPTSASAGTGASGRRSERGGGFGGASGATGFTGAPGVAGGATGAGGTEGTIASINRDTLYITEASGNTVKVTLSSATTLTKTVAVTKRSLYPGDTVSVTGASGTDGGVSATAVADSGAATSSTSGSTSSTSSAGTAGASGSTGSTGSTGSSGLNSLFGNN
jgi:hypothetical protein